MKRFIPNLIFLFSLTSTHGFAETAFKIDKKKTTVKELYKDNESDFYDFEKQKYELIEKLAHEKYLNKFWSDLAKKNKTSEAVARQQYFSKNANVSDKEIEESLKRFKDHPRLKDLTPDNRKRQIVDYLTSLKNKESIDQIIAEAISSKKLEISYPRPKEPIFEVTVNENDPVKYGPDSSDTKPLGCSGSKCAITVVEYSEFECPFCERVLPSVSRLMSEYKGKVRWIVRDFPLGFHKRARPAAIAARCAFDQGKYWQMYETLFKNQRSLEDKDLKSYAKSIGLDMKKFEKCWSSPTEQVKVIDENYRSGEKLGVTGTPAFFINGRRMSGALPYSQFKKVFDEELRN